MQDKVCRDNCVEFRLFWHYIISVFRVARDQGYNPGLEPFTHCPWCGAELIEKEGKPFHGEGTA